ncbi:15-hydroxyprostaglandin dehydrogenase [NAD(+)]-like [Synchiropus splendidus]|uniref:15-hydroxyprostaglandin dehydrogenase [NAD(+)]-like n=1 Tax=Synchiropus splendidus TaxID=270530 RepID=UPI00237D7C06|nr:15-hydroxyprostaglandin dehydrogenase [NAD(+)]-like [Synchiropus splendidus]XP_053703628.1 15-hydroxyprostaglandin dehydrogenase [NAD(+)]-like [Synchiropus splendidus]XP_053703629.1 15-hydroxyprostaglandin dehydrogenase [NAD(+)]-like [Synchiropus splendidus]
MALKGKTAVVTGAAMGIGRAITEILLKNGTSVVLLDVNEGAGKSLKETLDPQFGKDKSMFLSCNVESEEQVKAAFQKTIQKFGRIDILCNNAGIVDEETWRKEISINVVSVVAASFLALDHMNKLKGGSGGHIINMASVAGLGAFPSSPVYVATKHAVVGFTRSMALASSISGYGVRFNAVCPFFVETEMLKKSSQLMGQFSHLKDYNTPLLERVGMMQPSVVAEAVLELVMDETKDGQAVMVKPKERKYVTFPAVEDL